MKIKIDSHGWLWIERAGAWKDQTCPCDVMDECHCGDWCPHFGEPDRPDIRDLDVKYSRLIICQGRVLTGEIVDERVKK